MNIKIYIANLGKYNEGELVGDWIELPATQEELNELYAEIKLGYFDEDGNYHHGYEEDGYFYEEWAIHDYEAPFRIDEYESISNLNEIAEVLSGANREQVKIAVELIDYGIEGDLLDAVTRVINYRDISIHHGANMSEIARRYYEENGMLDMDNYLARFIDWDRVGREMNNNGTFIQVEDELWVEVY